MKALIIVALISTSAYARDVQRRPKPPPPAPPPVTINIGPLELDGRLRTISMLDFIERANAALERATLEKKSFIPKIVASLDEEQL